VNSNFVPRRVAEAVRVDDVVISVRGDHIAVLRVGAAGLSVVLEGVVVDVAIIARNR
jgi:hypothetical protein